MKYKWQVYNSNDIAQGLLTVAYDLEIIAKLLLNRNIDSVEKAKAYLNPTFYIESLPQEIPNLIFARDRIIAAINKNEKITVFGDYDVDGITATACLLTVIKQFTENVDFYIPSRLTEGYGLNSDAIKKIAGACHGKSLLITCDCGITNYKEVELANKLGIDVIVTDHHSLPEVLPPACAVLNPKLLPMDHKLHFLPGVGVAYKLAEAILNQRSEVSRQRPSLDSLSQRGGRASPLAGSQKSGEQTTNDEQQANLLDLVTLGMIADLVPLVGENRFLVQVGLEKLANTTKVGLQELLRICGFSQRAAISTDHIGFGIAPRINAIGRLRDANLAVKLLITSDLQEATQIATELDFQNRERQLLCEETLKEAIEMIEEERRSIGVSACRRVGDEPSSDRCIILAKEGWHHGVVGIVASRIVEKFSLPTILIAIDKEQNIARGSGRSIEHLNIVDAIVNCSCHLEKFGGHKAACGFSIKPENINNFILDFTNFVNNQLDNTSLEPVLRIDAKLPISSLTIELINKIFKLAPFGLGNPFPLFVSEEVEIIGIRNIGKNGQHLKLIIKEAKSSRFEALIWNYDRTVQLNLGDLIKIAYSPKLNNYNGEVFIQLEVKDWQILETSRQRQALLQTEDQELEMVSQL